MYKSFRKISSNLPLQHQITLEPTNYLSIDQLSSTIYAPLVFFYSDFSKRSDTLKKSLSETLTSYYPFAGQLKDSWSIDCNDHGVDCIEANIDIDMSKVMEKPDMDMLHQLLPRNLQVNYDQLCNESVLAVQINHFSCGKMAIGICIWHGLADGSAAVHFMKNWAAVTRGATTINNIDNLVVDFTSTFRPQQDFSMVELMNIDHSSTYITKRLFFDGFKIEALTQKLISESGLAHISPIAAVSTLIWSACIVIAQQKQRKFKTHVALNAMNLRRRMKPPLHEQCIGNVLHIAKAEILEETNIAEDYNVLVREMVKCTRMVNNVYVKKIHEDVGYIKYIKHLAEASHDSSVIFISILCRFPFYEVDFGSGKPIWCSAAVGGPHIVHLMDSKDGGGIEAWVTLSIEDIEKLEQNPKITTYASINPAV